jgi:hypothetical protein
MKNFQTLLLMQKPNLRQEEIEHIYPPARGRAILIDAMSGEAARLLASMNASMAGPRLDGEFVDDPWTSPKMTDCIPVDADDVYALSGILQHHEVKTIEDFDGSRARTHRDWDWR